MKIFVSFRFTGEDPQELENTLSRLRNHLAAQGHECLCTFWDEEKFQKEKFTPEQILNYCLVRLDQSDMVLALVTSNEKSEGMLLESGYALAKGKPILLAMKKGVKTYFLPHIAKQVVEFENMDDLCKKLIFQTERV